MKSLAAPALLLVAALAAGCGPTCQSTCQHVYGESECGLTFPGRDEAELVRDCIKDCEYALARTGDATYDPTKKTAANDDNYPELKNEQEAAAWMECVWEIAPEGAKADQCEKLDPSEGYCAPI